MPINRYTRHGLVILAIVFLSTMPGVAQKKDISLLTLNDCWHYDTPGLASSQPATDKSNIYIAEDGGRVSAISLSTGTKLWTSELGGEIRSNIAVVGPSVFVATGQSAGASQKGLRLHMLSSSTGIPNFDIEIPPAEDIRLLPTAGKIVAITDKGYVAAYDIGATKPTWLGSYPALQPQTAIAWNDKIIVGSVDPKIYLRAVSTGAQISSIETEYPISALGVIDGDIVWGDDRGNLVRYDFGKHSVYWKFRNGARISGLAVTDDGVVAVSLDNFAYLVSPYYGSVRWKKRLSGRISGIEIGSDPMVVLQTVGDPTAAILDLENGKSVGQVTISEDETFNQAPVFVDGRFIFFTNRRVFARSAEQCSAK